jgi:phage gp16-like protein
MGSLKLLSIQYFFYVRKKLILTIKIIKGDCYKLKFQDEIEKYEGAN